MNDIKLKMLQCIFDKSLTDDEYLKEMHRLKRILVKQEKPKEKKKG